MLNARDRGVGNGGIGAQAAEGNSKYGRKTVTPRKKSMEASAITKMVEDALYNHFFIIDVSINDVDSKMRDVLKHPSKGARSQVLKSAKGKLYEEIPEPSFLADPFHRVKVIAKHIFSIVNKSKYQQCGCIKADTFRLKKDWGYMIKNNR